MRIGEALAHDRLGLLSVCRMDDAKSIVAELRAGSIGFLLDGPDSLGVTGLKDPFVAQGHQALFLGIVTENQPGIGTAPPLARASEAHLLIQNQSLIGHAPSFSAPWCHKAYHSP